MSEMETRWIWKVTAKYSRTSYLDVMATYNKTGVLPLPETLLEIDLLVSTISRCFPGDYAVYEALERTEGGGVFLERISKAENCGAVIWSKE